MDTSLNQILYSMPSALIAFNLEYQLIFWTKICNSYTKPKLLLSSGLNLYTAFPLLLPYKEFITRAVNDKTIAKQDSIEILMENKNVVFFDLLIYPFGDENQNCIGYVIRLDDVTKQAYSREEILQTKKLISVGTMAAGIAHEIKNPLSIILNATSNIQRRLSPDLTTNQEIAAKLKCDLNIFYQYLNARKIIEFMHNITTAANRINEIVINILDYCRGSVSTLPKKVSILSIVTKTLLLARLDQEMQDKYKFSSVQIITNIAPNLPEVICYEAEIEQVLYNLIRNSIQAMVAAPKNRKIEIIANLKDNFIYLSCLDNGRGIAPTDMHKIFTPLFSTKGELGNGLGLSICKEIMLKQQGDLLCESEFGKYAKFTLVLPIAV